ncbi:hypothetical protein L465_03677 [Enterobacter sp. BIDMC 29]|uniref:hypothetical protein n=1 Tax=Enterobacter sp. BIDMC 29 TaxID=1329841 RepID=UPI00044D6B33|nr:hypothetical protein [Enterobacter sp. BIDMC 29]EUM08145.1 hypothetical protein L465_03677 [Enterobacter sp. BIDMC 29]
MSFIHKFALKPILNNKHSSLFFLLSLCCAGSITSAHATDCGYWKTVYDNSKKRSGGGGTKMGLATISSAMRAIKGCMDEKTLPFVALESEPFHINETGYSTLLRIAKWTSNHDLELWTDAGKGYDATKTFRLMEPVEVYLSDKYYAEKLFRIQGVGGPAAGECLGINRDTNEANATPWCTIGEMKNPVFPGTLYNTSVALWSIEEVGDEVRFHAYVSDGYDTDWHNGRYPVYHYAGSLGLNGPGHKTTGYFGWTDVLPSNTRTWSLYPEGVQP